MLFKEAQGGAHNVAGAVVAALFDLGFDEGTEMVADAEGGVFGWHMRVIPIFGTNVNMSVSCCLKKISAFAGMDEWGEYHFTNKNGPVRGRFVGVRHEPLVAGGGVEGAHADRGFCRGGGDGFGHLGRH